MVVATVAAQPARGEGQTGRGFPREGVQAKFYTFLGRTGEIASDAVITGMVLICHMDALVLFDLGSTYSYVSSYFALYLDISHDFLSSPLYVFTPVGDSIIVDRVYWLCLVDIGGFETIFDLLLLIMVYFDVILGMDWLSPYHAILDCRAKTAQKIVEKGCDAYISLFKNVSVDTPVVESILVVRDFPDVFLADHSGMLPDRDIDFGTDLLPDTKPISIPPYRMAPAELKEQLQ
ncbi:uncharacterized protein [Nicotiana tomentosiformis]|uniref:uncharacterized protein n=1 Tax=Nicotiana tomentosiformis TaxID=4098 RepID=UPI00388CD5A0